MHSGTQQGPGFGPAGPALVRSEADEMSAALGELAGQIHAANAELVALLARFDAIGGWHGIGIRSLGHWASIHLGIDVRTATQHTQAGHRLEALPAIAAAARAGELGWAKLQLLARVAQPDTQAKWLGPAREMAVGQLARVVTNQLAKLPGARTASSPLPPPPLPAGSIRAQRRVHASGRIMVANQPIKLGPRHAGKLVTVVGLCHRRHPLPHPPRRRRTRHQAPPQPRPHHPPLRPRQGHPNDLTGQASPDDDRRVQSVIATAAW